MIVCAARIILREVPVRSLQTSRAIRLMMFVFVMAFSHGAWAGDGTDSGDFCGPFLANALAKATPSLAAVLNNPNISDANDLEIVLMAVNDPAEQKKFDKWLSNEKRLRSISNYRNMGLGSFYIALQKGAVLPLLAHSAVEIATLDQIIFHP